MKFFWIKYYAHLNLSTFDKCLLSNYVGQASSTEDTATKQHQIPTPVAFTF